MDDLVLALGLWLQANFGMAAMPEPPRIRHFSAEHLAAIHYGRPGMGAGDILGIYDSLTRTIGLRSDWNPSRPQDMSVLVHELVHHFQSYDSNAIYACAQEREALAFEAQEAWLGQFDLNLAETFEIDAFSLMFKTRCVPY